MECGAVGYLQHCEARLADEFELDPAEPFCEGLFDLRSSISIMRSHFDQQHALDFSTSSSSAPQPPPPPPHQKHVGMSEVRMCACGIGVGGIAWGIVP